MSGYLTFTMAGRELAARLDQVREVVRAVGVEPLPGVRAPVTGLLELRGDPLPVVDLRQEAEAGGTGDVVVLVADHQGALGLAVDRVIAVVAGDTFAVDGAPLPAGLPGYVTEVLRATDGSGRPVFLVDLRVLAGVVPASPPPAGARP